MSRAVQLKQGGWSRSKYLFYRIILRKTASHFWLENAQVFFDSRQISNTAFCNTIVCGRTRIRAGTGAGRVLILESLVVL